MNDPAGPCALLVLLITALTHAALGFVVEESQAKHVLEFYALDYVGSFLPDVPPPPPTPAPSTLSPTFAPTSLGTPSPTTSSGNGTATAAPTPAPTAAANGTTLVPTPAPTVVGNWTTDPPTPVVTPSPSFGSNLTDSYDGADYRDFGRDLLARGVESAPARAGESSVEGGRFGGVGDSEGGRGGQNWVSGASGSRIVGNGTSEVTWSNDANMRPALGFDENRWIAANYVGKITGLLFNDLQGWSTAYLADHPVYQPLSACGGSNDRNGNGDFLSKGSANSYDFVWAAFERLARCLGTRILSICVSGLNIAFKMVVFRCCSKDGLSFAWSFALSIVLRIYLINLSHHHNAIACRMV